MGAIASVAYAATDPALAGVVLVSSPADWRIPFRIRALITVALARTKLGRLVAARHTHVRIYPQWNPTEPPRSVAKRVVSAVPLAIVHGRNDHLIPFHFSLGVSTTEIPGAHAVVVPGMGHAFDPVGHRAICDDSIGHSTGLCRALLPWLTTEFSKGQQQPGRARTRRFRRGLSSNSGDLLPTAVWLKQSGRRLESRSRPFLGPLDRDAVSAHHCHEARDGEENSDGGESVRHDRAFEHE